jgi:hypothetical protein
MGQGQRPLDRRMTLSRKATLVKSSNKDEELNKMMDDILKGKR